MRKTEGGRKKKKALPKDRERKIVPCKKVRARVPGSGRQDYLSMRHPWRFGMQAYQLTVGQSKFTHENPAISHGSRDKPMLTYLHCHCVQLIIHGMKRRLECDPSYGWVSMVFTSVQIVQNHTANNTQPEQVAGAKWPAHCIHT